MSVRSPPQRRKPIVVTMLAWSRGGSTSGQAVVAVHGWARDGTRDWQDSGWVAGLASAGFAVYVCDLPGHGGSADVALPQTVEPAAWTAATILDDLEQLGIDAFSAAGYAEGCLVASHLAVRAPQRVRHLVLVGCDDQAAMTNAAEIAAGLRDRRATVWRPDAADAVAQARADRRHHLPTLADWAERAVWPAAPRLGGLRIPVLLAVGADDHRRERAPRLARLFHDGHLVTVPGDHRACLREPDLVRVVSRFLAEDRQ